MIKVIIAGSRTFNDYELLAKVCDHMLCNQDEVEIVSGKEPKGADKLGELYAEEKGYRITDFPAYWGEFGNAAGPMRNKQMAEYADALIAFWNGDTIKSGTYNMIQIAKSMELKVKVCEY